MPEAFRATVQPLIPAIVDGIHRAFTIGVTVGLPARASITTILAAGAALFLKEIPLRTHTGEAPAAGTGRRRGRRDRRLDRSTGSPSTD